MTAGGKQFKASHAIDTTGPGKKVERRSPGAPASRSAWPRRSKSTVEPVPGETNLENNKNTYLAIFGE